MRIYSKKALAILVPLSFLIFVWWKTGICFETNDDRYIASILSGVITGSPDAHAIYVDYLLSLPLSILYRVTSAVPWYGGLLVVFQWMIYAAILDSAYTRCQKWTQTALVTVMTAGFFVAYYYCVGLIQFTSTACLLAMAGYVCILVHDNKKKGLLFFLLFEFLSYQLRNQAMLMLQPLGFAAVLTMMVARRDIPWRQRGKELLHMVAGLCLVLCISVVGNLVGYHGVEWARYQQYNDANVAMFDYYGKPSYKEVCSILEDYGISKEKYEAYCSYMVLDWEKDAECDHRLKEYVVNQGAKSPKIGEVLCQVYRVSIGDCQWKMGYVSMIAWGLFLLDSLLGKRWRTLCGGIVFLGGARTAVWSFLIWRGRLPVRVTFPLMACETMFLLVLIWNQFAVGTSLWKKCLLLFGCLAFCMAGISSGRLQSRFVREMNEGQAIFIAGLREMQEYFQDRTEAKFLVDANSLNSYKGSAFETAIYHPVNAVISGGWFSFSPGVQHRLEDYLGDAEGFYFVIYADGNQENTPQFSYLIQEMGETPKLVELWTASHGGVYGIYYFDGAFPFQ